MVRRLVPRQWVTVAQVDGELEALGWRRLDVRVALADAHVASTWRGASLRAVAAVVDDPFAGRVYLVLDGEDASVAAADLAQRLPEMTLDDALDMAGAANTREGLVIAIRGLGLVACGPYDGDAFEVITGMAVCGDAELQRAGLAAIACSSWPEFETTLDHLIAASDTDPEIRTHSAGLKAAMQRTGWNSALRGQAPAWGAPR